MTFYTFMMRKYSNADGGKHDFAMDMKKDKKDFPKNPPHKLDGWYRIIKSYLLKQGACTGCMQVFEECWKEYVVCVKRKSSRNW